MPEKTWQCFYCQTSPATLCEECGLVAVCGEACARIHRPASTCLPFTVEYRGEKGNVVVAVRDIKPFETILLDKPAIIGPFDDTKPECLECYSEVSVSGYKCSRCNLPLCGPECEDGPTHAPECKVLQAASPPISIEDDDSAHPVYAAVASIRMLHVMRTKPEVWQQVDRLMDHLEGRRKEDKWSFVTDHVIPLITERCGVACEPELLERIIGIFRTNSVKWEDKSKGPCHPIGHALCPLFSMMCHSCVNNTRYTQTMAGEMIVRAAKLIKKGEEITIQYRGPNTGNILRRPDFPTNWLFSCDCPRCVDPTELGTMASTMRCSQCASPSLLPATSELDSVWRCTACNREEDHQNIVQTVQILEMQLDAFPYSASPEEWEDLLKRFQLQLHDDHYLCMKAKRMLLQIYGAREGYKLDQMSRELLDRKIDLCRNYIDIFTRLEPGYRVWKGRLLEELLGPLTITVNRDLEDEKINKMQYILRYKEIVKMVKEAAQCRQFEERDSNDEVIGQFYQSWMKPLQVGGRD